MQEVKARWIACNRGCARGVKERARSYNHFDRLVASEKAPDKARGEEFSRSQ